MPRVHTQKARKDYPKEGIKKGDIYYKWSIKTGPASGIDYRSLTPPKPSQLTGSPFMQEYYSIQEMVDELAAESAEDLQARVEEIVGSIENLRDETQGSLDNMPEGLQQGDTGQLLQERIDALDGWLSDIEGVNLDFEFDEEEPADPGESDPEATRIWEEEHDKWAEDQDEAEQEFIQATIEEIQGLDAGL